MAVPHLPPPPNPHSPLTMAMVARPLLLTTMAMVALFKGLDTYMLAFSLASIAMGLEAAVWTPKFLAWANCKPSPWWRYVQIGVFFLVWIVNPIRILTGLAWGVLWFAGIPTFVWNRHRWHQMWARRRARRDGHMATNGVTPGAVLAGGAGQQATVPTRAMAMQGARSIPPPVRVGATHDDDRILSYTPVGDIQLGGWDVDEQGFLR